MDNRNVGEREVRLVHPREIPDRRALDMVAAIGGFPSSDRPLFMAAYSELCRVDLSGKRALEICGGAGRLAGCLAEVFPAASVIGLDLYQADGPEVRELVGRLPGLSYIAGNAFDLSRFPDEHFDLIFGQAALHHLAHDLTGLSREVLRVLKPGGRLVFVFEPMGHNPLVAAVRAVRMSRGELEDESNLFCSQFARMKGCGFSGCEVQMFNLLGYPMKAVSDRWDWICRAVHRVDGWMFGAFPGLLRYGANANVILTR